MFIRNREIVLEEEFLKGTSDSWIEWILNLFVKKPLTWSYYKMKDYVIGQNMDINTRYVHLKTVKEIAELILSTIVNENENILISTSEILEKCKKEESLSDVSENTLNLALIWLKHHKKVVLKRSSINNELLVKFSMQTIQEISELEETLYKLLNHESKLEREIELLEKEKILIMDKVKTCLAKELRQLAKTHLRKKKEIEKTIEKRAQVLGNLHALILSIQDTHSSSGMIEAFKLGSNILSKFEEKGLTECKVRDVMDDVNEVFQI